MIKELSDIVILQKVKLLLLAFSVMPNCNTYKNGARCPDNSYERRLVFCWFQDTDMLYEPTNTPAMARTSNLNEELGQVTPPPSTPLEL